MNSIRDWPELDDVLGRVHRRMEAAEMAGTDCAPAEQRRQLQLDPGGEAERAFRAHQDVREIEVVAAGHERVEVVAADTAQHFREARLDLVGLARADRAAGRAQAAAAASRRAGRRVPARTGPKCAARAVRQHHVDRHTLSTRVAVAQRARAAGIVADHAADGGARGGRDVDREPQAVRLELAVELVEHDAGLDHAAPAGDVELEDVVEMTSSSRRPATALTVCPPCEVPPPRGAR